MNETLVTVIVPAYNHEKYIIECLESVNNQTFKDFQWIVVDDCSKDRTPEILKENQEKYGYELILHEKNKGISATLTETIKDYAKGKYLTFCSSDDAFLPIKIESQLRYLQENPQYAMCYSRSILINENSEELSDKDTTQYKSGYIFEDILCRKFFLGIDTMYRTEVIRELGYYESGVMAEDYYMYSKIAQKYQIGFLNQYLYKYRVVELSTKRDPWKLVMSHRQTVDMFKDDALYPKAVKAWEIRSAAIISFYTKYKGKAIWFVVKNLDYYILHPNEAVSVAKFLILRWK